MSTGPAIAPLVVHAELEAWPLKTPFRITGHVWHLLSVLRVTLTHDGHTGQGEGAGVFYRGDTAERMLEQVRSVQREVTAGIDRNTVQRLLAPGGARNAVDCAAAAAANPPPIGAGRGRDNITQLDSKCCRRRMWSRCRIEICDEEIRS